MTKTIFLGRRADAPYSKSRVCKVVLAREANSGKPVSDERWSVTVQTRGDATDEYAGDVAREFAQSKLGFGLCVMEVK